MAPDDGAEDTEGGLKGGGLSGGPAKAQDAGGGADTQEQPGAMLIISHVHIFIVFGHTHILIREEGVKEVARVTT